MKFEFTFQGLYEQIENVVSKIYFQLNVSFNARKCDPQSYITLLVSNNSTLFVTGMNKWLNPIFPYFICNDDGKNQFQVYHNYALRLIVR